MIVLRPSKREMQLASLVSKALSLEDIFLSSVHLDSNFNAVAMPPDVPFRMDVQLHDADFEIFSEHQLAVKVGLTVAFEMDASDVEVNGDFTPLPKGEANVSFVANYRIMPKGPIPEEILNKGFSAFAKFNGVFNCWPYMRTTVHRLTCDMGMPFMLPLLKVESLESDETAKKGSRPVADRSSSKAGSKKTKKKVAKKKTAKKK